MITRLPWENDVLTIRQLLNYTSEKYNTKPCIRFIGKDDEVITKTYCDLRRDSIAFSVYLKKQSAEKRHIALIANTSYEYLTALNGIMAAGDVAVPMGYDLTAEKMQTILKDCDASCVICDNRTEQIVTSVVNNLPMVKEVINIDNRVLFGGIYSSYNSADDEILPEENPDDTTVIIYTSGTTGIVKGACLCSRAIISNIYFEEMSFEGDNVALNVLPMHHIFCFSCDYLKNLKDGVTICLNGEINNIAANLLRFEPSVIRIVPMIFDSLAKKVRVIKRKNSGLTPRQAAERVFGKRITNIIVSGAAFVASVADEFEEMGIQVRQGYGMTETGPRIAVPDGKTCAASGGRVISLCKVRIADTGEIQVQSPSLMSGYYKMPGLTEEQFTDDGWYKTGDIGRLTEDNELFITGRIKNLIILSNGENVSPEEIEKKISQNPLIKEIVVYAVKNMICADIFPDADYAAKSGITDIEQEIGKITDVYNHECEPSRQLASVNISDTPLPKTSTGKLSRTIH